MHFRIIFLFIKFLNYPLILRYELCCAGIEPSTPCVGEYTSHYAKSVVIATITIITCNNFVLQSG
jgi:uncharacterized membrane protein YccC